MLIGYARVSKADGSQLLDLQLDSLIGAGIAADRIYADRVSSRKDHRSKNTVADIVKRHRANALDLAPFGLDSQLGS